MKYLITLIFLFFGLLTIKSQTASEITNIQTPDLDENSGLIFYNNNIITFNDSGGEANLLDSDKDIIVNPQLSNRDFGKYNYSEWCGYFCVPDNKNLNMARNNYFKNKLHYPSDKNCTNGYV